MPNELKPELGADFASDFRDGEAMVREWIAGRGNLPDLLHIVRDMPPRRRRLDHERRARFEELAANNASIPIGSIPPRRL